MFTVKLFLLRQAGTWDPRPFAAELQSLHLDTPLLEQQNRKKLYGTKNNCKHAHLGKIWTNAIKRPKEKKNQLPLLKSLEQKQGTVHAPCTHHLTGGQTT